jgi:hydrogenase nickel incorporation protein HypA/HybF
MHELSLAEALVGQLAEVAAREGATRIVRIDLELGAMSGVEREPFEFAFPIVARGTPAQDAILAFDEVPVTVRCGACGRESSPEFPMIVCVHCASTAVDVVRGRDFKVRSMEVD